MDFFVLRHCFRIMSLKVPKFERAQNVAKKLNSAKVKARGGLIDRPTGRLCQLVDTNSSTVSNRRQLLTYLRNGQLVESVNWPILRRKA